MGAPQTASSLQPHAKKPVARGVVSAPHGDVLIHMGGGGWHKAWVSDGGGGIWRTHPPKTKNIFLSNMKL